MSSTEPVVHHHWEINAAMPGPAEAPAALWGVLGRRGIVTDAEWRRFLDPCPTLWGDPLGLKDMDRAVEAVLGAMKDHRRICIYGDYDADGLTGTVALWRLLKPRYDPVGAYLPWRREGYGLTRTGLDAMKKSGVSLVITVDNGTTAVEQVEYARSLGLEVVITDHHQPDPGQPTPRATALINPHQAGCDYDFKHLSGCAVAFKLGVAVAQQLGLSAEEALENEVDLLALSCLSDRMALSGENRLFARRGLLSLQAGRRTGIKALKDCIGLRPGRVLTGYDMDFQIIPRLNASGRMGDPMTSFRLLVENGRTEASRLARQLEDVNLQRRDVQADVYRQVARKVNLNDPPWAVVVQGDWHFGVLGVVAGRVAESAVRPTVLLCPSGEKRGHDAVLKGSARNPTHADLLGLMRQAVREGMALKAGGHHAAMGVELLAPALEDFQALLVEGCAQALNSNPPVRTLEIDGELSLRDVDETLLRALEAMEPFGVGNAAPQFVVRNLKVTQVQFRGGSSEHLKLWVVDRQGHEETMMFFQGGRLLGPTALDGAVVDVVSTVSRETWPGGGLVSWKVTDLRLSAVAQSGKMAVV